ncbi:MAG: hypothetical protein PGN16_16270 [Sphingomonas phyllosphaerae]|uniref:hypothetical protein n=1 Tax=Sphingomonas phyllosphaerae TaxID=257003 RepID=UPI002FF8B5C3
MLALPAGGLAQQAFPCAILGKTEARIFEGFEPASEPKGNLKPIKVRKGAVLGEEKRAIRTGWMMIDPPSSSTKSSLSPMAFAPYMIGSQTHLCTSMFRSEVFGQTEDQNNYLLRCVLDADKDGRYDHFHRYAELVSTNLRTGKSEKGKGVEQSDNALPQAFRLVTLADGAAIPNAAFEPRVVQRLAIQMVSKDEMIVGLASDVSILPDAFDARRNEAAQRITIPLRDGAEGKIGGWEVTVQQAGGGWTATAHANPSIPPATFTCDGAVVVTGDAYTVVGPGGSRTLSLTQALAAAAQ